MMLNALLILIFIRPFISSVAFPGINFIYSYFFLTYLIIFIFLKKVRLKNLGNIKSPLYLFILALIISVLFSYSKLISLQELYKYIIAILLLLAAISLSEKEKSKTIRAMIFAGFIISILALYQYFFGFGHTLDYINKMKITNPFAIDYLSRKRIFFPFITPNALAGYLILIIPLIFTGKNKDEWIIAACALCALFLTKSMGAIISLFITATALYVYLKKGFSFVKIMPFIILAALAAVIFIMRKTAAAEHTLPGFSLTQRLNYWRNALEIIKAHPLAGTGIGNFDISNSRYAHNSYLQIMAEMGFLGLISFFWIIGTVIARQKDTSIFLIITCFAFLVHNIVDFTFFLPEVSFIWWTILGLIYNELTKSITLSSFVNPNL